MPLSTFTIWFNQSLFKMPTHVRACIYTLISKTHFDTLHIYLREERAPLFRINTNRHLPVRCYTVMPVARMNSVSVWGPPHHHLVSVEVSCQLAKLHISNNLTFYSFGLYASRSDLPDHMGNQLTVPCLAFYASRRTVGCVLFSVSPLLLVLAY